MKQGYLYSMIAKFNDVYIWLLFLILLVNLYQRKIKNTQIKLRSTIYMCLLSLFFYLGVVVIDMNALSYWFILIPLALTLVIGYILRARVWPFTLHCRKCGRKLPLEYILGHDDCLCQECHEELHPEEKAERERLEEEKRKKENPDAAQEDFMKAESIDDINWDIWEPTDRCVITYTEQDGKLLLIEKKRGLGDGYYNAPGGHIELEETAAEACIRETKEETGLDITDPEYRGTLYFQFKHRNIREIGYVYHSYGATGELKECDEARPFWIDMDKIPYENMWEDDRLWLPGMLEGRKFEAYFLFDDRRMVDKKVVWLDEE